MGAAWPSFRWKKAKGFFFGFDLDGDLPEDVIDDWEGAFEVFDESVDPAVYSKQ
jgi:hypothetical protein